jgi:phenylacetate-CoA ligase
LIRAWRRLRWSAFVARHARGDERLPFRPLAEVLAIQSQRARAIARHAWRTVPHYRDAMRAAAIDPREVRGAEDLWRLSRLTGDDLAAAPERFASSLHPPSQTLALRSSGTGGRPKVVRYDSAALFLALAHGRRQRAVFATFVGRRRGYREMTAHRSSSVSHQLRRFYEENAWTPRVFDLERSSLSLEIDFDEALARIAAERPDVIYGYGSYLGALFRWAHERRRAFHRPRLLWYGADRMSDADRSLIEHDLGLPVVSTYQADEALRIGFQCERREGFHLSLDDVAVRVVDERDRPVPPGQAGRIVISNLTNRATVLLNYELGDFVTLAPEPCPCGRSLPLIERIEGRADDRLLLAGGEVRHPLAVLERLQAVAGVAAVQIVQHALDRFEVLAVVAAVADWRATREALERALRGTVGAAPAVAVERVDALPRQPGGKVRAVVSRLEVVP